MAGTRPDRALTNATPVTSETDPNLHELRASRFGSVQRLPATAG